PGYVSLSEKKRLGVPPHLYCRPLTARLTEGSTFAIIENPSAQNAIFLRQHELDAAFLSPIEYAREGSEYRIVPRVALSSSEGVVAAVLCFREKMKAITTMAADPAATSEIVLAKILLGEQFDVQPKIVPAVGSLSEMLAVADAALLVGNAALGKHTTVPYTIDLVEEWFEMTDLPYVHGFWCGREGALSKDEIRAIQHARTEGGLSLHDVSKGIPPAAASALMPYEIEEYLEHFSYDLPDDVQYALTEFLRYAYFHGVLPDVPDIEFYSLDVGPDLPAAPLLN
ncbi:MAG: mqnA, partial [Bacteroidetes bacterium]|nr:mqnA [Bacteroidota bacterium]